MTSSSPTSTTEPKLKLAPDKRLKQKACGAEPGFTVEGGGFWKKDFNCCVASLFTSALRNPAAPADEENLLCGNVGQTVDDWSAATETLLSQNARWWKEI